MCGLRYLTADAKTRIVSGDTPPQKIRGAVMPAVRREKMEADI